MRDKLEDAFLRLRAAAHADEYVPMEDVIEFVLAENERLRAEAHHAQALRSALCVARAAIVDPVRLTLPQIDAALAAHAAHLKAGEDK